MNNITNSNSSFERFESEDGIELVIDTRTGKAFATQAGYARMSDIPYPTVRKRIERLEGSDKKSLEMAVIPTPGGEQDVTLIPSRLVGKWLVKDNPELAEAMLEAGATAYIYNLAGYKFQIVEPTPKTSADIFLESAIAFKEQEMRLSRVEAELAKVKENAEIVELETVANTAELERFRNGHGFWYSIIGYAVKMGNKKLSLLDAANLGRKAAALCKLRNIIPQPISDPRFGTVGTYPDSVLMEIM